MSFRGGGDIFRGDYVMNMSDPSMVSSRIYVGNIPANDPSFTKIELRDMFCKYGNILGTQMNRGFGFVQFDSDACALDAIATESGTMFRGKKIDVKAARIMHRSTTGVNRPEITRERLDINRDSNPRDQQSMHNIRDRSPADWRDRDHYSGPGGGDRGHLDRNSIDRGPLDRERGLGFMDRERGPVPMDRERGPGSMDRERGPGSMDRERGPAPMDRERGPAMDRERGPAPMDRERGPAPMDRERGPAPMDRERGPPPMARERGPAPMGRERGPAPMDRERGPAPMDRERGPAPMDRERGPAPMDRERGPAPMDRERGPGNMDRERGPGNSDRERGPVPMDRERGPLPMDRERGPGSMDRERGPGSMDRERGPGSMDRGSLDRGYMDRGPGDRGLMDRGLIDRESKDRSNFYGTSGPDSFRGPPNFRPAMGDPPRAGPTNDYSTPGGNIPSVDRANDLEIIVFNKINREYGEYIERRLKQLGLSVDLLFPNEIVPIGRVLASISSRGTLYAIVVMPQNEEHRSLTLNILHGLPQEHRNMPLEDAVKLISRNFEAYVCGEKTGTGNHSVPSPISIVPANISGVLGGLDRHPDAIRVLLKLLSDDRQLTVLQYDKVIRYLETKRELQVKIELGDSKDVIAQAPVSTKQEVELQNRILNILNSSNSSSSAVPTPVSAPAPVAAPTAVPSPTAWSPMEVSHNPLLSDPTVQKALDSLLQGNLLKNITKPHSFAGRF